MWFNNANVCVHQANTHLGFTHIVMEGFVIAVHRHLSQSHPVFKLLAPHFLYLIAINERGVGALLEEEAIFDSLRLRLVLMVLLS
ncbi:hypothetical protein DPMN_176651 [Dreissena polymorpha]|uniref:Lipoxygenase domain-containing protein n=1 Tax=Dreissena polymorpha TaxID=45954 RepID=A0A9D4IH39_DREPO|nr:hypothetical protein DPMN_176651 [Dreissena polymorpha]